MTTDPLPLSSHEQIATFRVGAILGTQAVAAYVESDQPGDPFAPASPFECLPTRLKIRRGRGRATRRVKEHAQKSAG